MSARGYKNLGNQSGLVDEIHPHYRTTLYTLTHTRARTHAHTHTHTHTHTHKLIKQAI